MTDLTRRDLIQRAALASGAIALGPAFWQRAVASAATIGDGPYGPLGAPDANGIRLPAGFQARLIARGNETIEGTSYSLPIQPDGQTTFAKPDGGWILVTNAEAPPPAGGSSAIHFGPDGKVTDAFRILMGTTLNCSGGRTPWGTWLSCEEVDESEYVLGRPLPAGTAMPANPFRGAVWECDPTKPGQGIRRPALGLFKHEAVCVDPVGERLYLTEDLGEGCFYRFTPESYPDLSAGLLEVAIVEESGAVTWAEVPSPQAPAGSTPLRDQVEGATRFERGEGIWFDSGIVYVATTSDERLHAYDTITRRHSVVYDAKAEPGPLTDPDNITVSPSGDLYVCENTDGSDGGLDIAMLTPDLTLSRFLRVEGDKHIYDAPVLGPSELCGVVFDPSGTRMYFTSQRARESGGGDEPGPGEVYEVTGPFRLERPRTGPLSPGNPREAGTSIGPGQGGGGRLVGSAVGIEVPRRIAFGTFHRRGLPVAITLAAPANVEVTVTSRFTAAAQRGRGGRRRSFRLERVARRYPRAGAQLLRVRPGRRTTRLLAGRRHPLRLAVRVEVDGEAVIRTTVLGAAPRRRRRRARRR